MQNWSETLKIFCDLYFNSGKKIDWIIVGSVGSVLQGAEMKPNDIDIYTNTFDGVSEISSLLEQFQSEIKSMLSHHDPNWLSSRQEPYFTESFASGFTWTKGKWKINSFDVEVVHISNSAGIPDSEQGEGIWEGGKYIWKKAKYVNFGKYNIPVVPLEIQLESNFRRNREDRKKAIINALKSSKYDKELLFKAVSRKNHDFIKDLL